MDDLVKYLRMDISGELGFVTTEELIYEHGNIGIPVKMIQSLFYSANNVFINCTDRAKKLDATMVLLSIHPDHYTAVNYRKRQLLLGNLDWKREVVFIKFIQTKHLSKPMLWAHLYWLYRQGYTNAQDDLEFCTFAAERYRCNYPCWSYRRRVLSQNPELMVNELLVNKNFVKSHISDYSGWSFRIWLILRLPDTELDLEIEWVKKLITLYPKHDSLWQYFRLVCRIAEIDETTFLQSLSSTEHGAYPYIASKFLEKFKVIEKSITVPTNIHLPTCHEHFT
jgi:hypothetical protein